MYLSFFHVFYDLLERATHALLGFLKILFYFLITLANVPVLKEIASLLPKTLYGIWKYFQMQAEFQSMWSVPNVITYIL